MNLETVGWKEAADGVSNPTADEMLIAKKKWREYVAGVEQTGV